MKRIILTAALTAMVVGAVAQTADVDRRYQAEMSRSHFSRKLIKLPQIDGYQTLKCDLHMHTIFSDGNQLPSHRVAEAWLDGLDALAITDHLTREPKLDYIKGTPNRSYELALKTINGRKGVTLIRGVEHAVKREQGGHMNALFITDAEAMLDKSFDEFIDMAQAQGGIVIWNHPGWNNPDCSMIPKNLERIKQGKITGIEIFNGNTLYPISIDWCKEYNLAPLACSDAHSPITNMYNGHMRPMTLVFATQNNNQSIKEAMVARRTLAMFNNRLAGDSLLLTKFVSAALKVTPSGKNSKGDEYLIENDNDIYFLLRLEKSEVLVPARSVAVLTAPFGAKSIKLRVENAFTQANTNLDIDLKLK